MHLKRLLLILPFLLSGCREKSNIKKIPLFSFAGSVKETRNGEKGFCPSKKVVVKDTTGAGDAFCAGVASALSYGKNMAQACEIGSRLAASVITSSSTVCPRFLPEELGIEV